MANNVVKIRKYGNSRSVSIPAHIQRALKWKVGDLVLLSVVNNMIVLRPIDVSNIPEINSVVTGVTVGDIAKVANENIVA